MQWLETFYSAGIQINSPSIVTFVNLIMHSGLQVEKHFLNISLSLQAKFSEYLIPNSVCMPFVFLYSFITIKPRNELCWRVLGRMFGMNANANKLAPSSAIFCFLCCVLCESLSLGIPFRVMHVLFITGK